MVVGDDVGNGNVGLFEGAGDGLLVVVGAEVGSITVGLFDGAGDGLLVVVGDEVGSGNVGLLDGAVMGDWLLLETLWVHFSKQLVLTLVIPEPSWELQQEQWSG